MNSNCIVDIKATEILDSRGNPTLHVEVITEQGMVGTASVPSGASTGIHEAVELRDGDTQRYLGKGVQKAIQNVTATIRNEVLDMDVMDTQLLDRTLIALDGTPNKSNLGANAILGVSMAATRAAAATQGVPLYRYLGGVNACMLPLPFMNIINGGAHANNSLDIQEFMIVPIGAANFAEAIRMGAEVFHTLKGILKAQGLNTAVGDEGGFAPNLPDNEAAIKLLIEAIEKAGYNPNQDILLALDVAATEFYDAEKQEYVLKKSSGKRLSGSALIEMFGEWTDKYPIVSIEDPLAEDDWDSWAQITTELGDVVQLVGDDLFVTNVERLFRGVENNTANAILIKPNQIGTITETLDAINTALVNDYRAMISHRSGETEDTFIADLAVALNTGQIKTGALSRSDRVAKYNRLLLIEEMLGDSAQFGADIFPIAP